MDYIERLAMFIRSLAITQRNFALRLGIKQQTVSAYLTKKSTPNMDFFVKVLELYPELNPEWIIDGKGEMLLKGNQSTNIHEEVNLNKSSINNLKNDDEMLRRIEQLERNNRELKETIGDKNELLNFYRKKCDDLEKKTAGNGDPTQSKSA